MPIAATGVISIENAEIAVLDSDVGSIESQKKYVTCIVVKQFPFVPTLIACLTIFLGNLYHLLLTIYFSDVLLYLSSSFLFFFGSLCNFCRLDLTKDGAVSLSANHLQKLRLSYQLTTPLGLVFKPHQVCSFPIPLY